MRKTTFNELREKEVINCCTGIRLGFVIDCEIDEECGRIISIIVSDLCKKLFAWPSKDQCIIICWENIQKIGEDIIVVNQEDCCVVPPPPPRKHKFW